MHELDDNDLLRQYAEQNSETAFAALVTRHVDKVYTTALRHTRNPHAAEEITQAVFVILTRKANKLSRHKVLSGWLYETARLTALTYIRSEIRRARREQEAHMQTILNENEAEAWPHIAPLLDDALAGLSAADRHAIVLRYFDGKSLGEVGAAMGANEDAAKKRVTRAVEKLRGWFTKRGVTLTATVLTAAISANSVQAAPLGLAATVTATAAISANSVQAAPLGLAATVTATAAKGAVVSGSTLTLIKGALKIMAWTKMKTAIAVGVGVLLAAGTGIITVKEIEKHRTYSWQVSKFDYLPVDAPNLLAKTPPQVRIVHSKFNHWVEGTPFLQGDGEMMVDGKIVAITNQSSTIGLGVTADEIVKTAYGADSLLTIFKTELPKGRFDFIANLPHGSLQALQEEIIKKLGLIGRWEMVETNVIVLKLADPDAKAFKVAKGFGNRMDMLKTSLQNIVGEGLPVIDKTGLTNRYDFSFTFPKVNTSSAAGKQAIKNALYNQLGLELVPSREKIEMLVVEKVK